MNGLLTRLTLKVNDMKKTFFTATCLLALVACAMVSACRKDDVGTIKENPVQVDQPNPGIWPVEALVSGDDTYDYGDARYHNDIDTFLIQRRELDRVESMLCVFYPSNIDINSLLPSGFSTVLPMDFSYYLPGTKGVITVFSGMDRSAAINQLKEIEEIFAIQPVYNWYDRLSAATPHVSVVLQNEKYEKELLVIADSLHLVFNRKEPFIDKQLFEFVIDHSLVNSVVAANTIYESLGKDYIYLSVSGFNYCDNNIND